MIRYKNITVVGNEEWISNKVGFQPTYRKESILDLAVTLT
jgi:hypothetical protein